MVSYCCVKGCLNNTNNVKKGSKAISFHAFPSNPELRQKWLEAIGRPEWNPPSHVRICSVHFNCDHVNQDGVRTRINEVAFPEKDLPANSFFMASEIEVCRICLASDVKMFSLRSGMLKLCMETLAGFNDNKVSIEGLPQCVCYVCGAELLKYYRLIEKSVIAQATLLDIFSDHGHISKDLVSERNRKQLNLQSSVGPNTQPTIIIDYTFKYEECEEDIHELSNIQDIDCVDIKESYVEVTQKRNNDGIGTELKDDKNSDILYYIEIDRKNLNNEKKTLKTEKPDCIEIENESVLSSDGEEFGENLSSRENESLKAKSRSKNTNRKQETDEKPHLILAMNKSIEKLSCFRVIDVPLQEQINQWKIDIDAGVRKTYLFQCDFCSYKFQSKKSLEKHLKNHKLIRGTHECQVCKERFLNATRLQCHILRTHAKRYECKKCPKVFFNMIAAQRHEEQHSVQVYQCGQCEFSTRHRSVVWLHRRRAHARSHHCARCGQAFLNATGLTLHLARAHQGQNDEPKEKFRCEKCEIAFNSEGALRIHLVSFCQHKDQTAPENLKLNTVCVRCGETFASRRELIDHKKRIHPKSRAEYKKKLMGYPRECDLCGVEMKSRFEHYWHVRRVHSKENYRLEADIVCEKCGRGFQNLTKFRYHMKSHSGAAPTFQCSGCPRRFHCRPELTRHAYVHRPDKPHACPHCGRAFKDKGNLVRHTKIHSEDTPFDCKICGKKFKYAATLDVHVKHVHKKVPWPSRTRKRRKKTIQEENTAEDTE